MWVRRKVPVPLLKIDQQMNREQGWRGRCVLTSAGEQIAFEVIVVTNRPIPREQKGILF